MGNPSRKFGPYDIIRRLGVGGMAETFEARRQLGGTEQRVCLKRILPAFSQDPKFNQQFLSEARLAATLRHSNIVGVLDFGAVHGTEYLALELIDGLDLRALLAAIDGHRLDAELVSLIALDLAYALSYAHNTREAGLEGIVHRDISPANVLVSVRGEVKLADFGIAKAMTNAQATASGGIKGKVAYMAPEQMRGKEVDGRSDLFALGVTLYEALAGERPFQGAHDVEVMTHLLAGERRALAEVVPQAPAPLVQAIEALVQNRPADRMASAEAFVDALGECAPAPTARRHLADLVQQLSGVTAPRPGADLTDLGPLDTELGAEPGPAYVPPAATPSKTSFKSTIPATPAVVQAAQQAGAAMNTAVGGAVPKLTIPASPRAIASAPPPSMPVPKGTMPASPRSIASSPPPSMASAHSTLQAKGGSPQSSTAPARPLHATQGESSTRSSTTGPTSAPDPSIQTAPASLRLEPFSDEVALPMDGGRPSRIAAGIGVLLLIGSGIVIGLRWPSGENGASAGQSNTAGVNSERRVTEGGGAASPDTSGVLAGGGEPNDPSARNGDSVAQPAGARVAGPESPAPTGTAVPNGDGDRAPGHDRISVGAGSASSGAAGDRLDGTGLVRPALAADQTAGVTPTGPHAGSGSTPARTPEVRTQTASIRTEPALDERARTPPAIAREAAEPRRQARAARMVPAGRSTSARVTIQSEPWGSVWVDGRYIGRSPAAVVLPLGPHELGGGVGHIMSTRRFRVTRGASQVFVVHVEYP